MRLYLNGKEFRRLREELGDEARQLAEKLKLGRSSFWRLTHEDSVEIDGMTMATFCRICESVKVSDPLRLLIVKREPAPPSPFQLERASMRLKHFVDLGNTHGEPAIKKLLNAYMTRHQKVKIVDTQKQWGVMRITQPAPPSPFQAVDRRAAKTQASVPGRAPGRPKAPAKRGSSRA